MNILLALSLLALTFGVMQAATTIADARAAFASSFAFSIRQRRETSNSKLNVAFHSIAKQADYSHDERLFVTTTSLRLLRAQQQQIDDKDDGDKNNDDDDDDDVVKIGTEEYYKGFVSRSLDEEPSERVTGGALLGPTFKFVAGFTVIIVGLLLGFLASNGLLL